MIRLLPLALLTLAACGPTAEPVPSATGDSASMVYLVRHAEKADDGTEDQPLSPEGSVRAEALADTLAEAGIDAIFVSSFQRTGLTAAPLAARLSLTPVVVEAGDGSDSLTARTARLIRALPAGSHALVVGHSNTIAPLIEALGGPATDDLPDCEYDTLFEMRLTPATLETRTFGPASTGEECEVPEMETQLP